MPLLQQINVKNQPVRMWELDNSETEVDRTMKEEHKPEIEKFMSPAKEGKCKIMSVTNSSIRKESIEVAYC